MDAWFVRLAGIGVTKSAGAVTGATASTGRLPGRLSRSWPGSARADRAREAPLRRVYCASFQRPPPLARYDRGPPAGKMVGRAGTFPVRHVVPGYCRAPGRGSITVSRHWLSVTRPHECRRDPATLNRMGAFL